jgi:TonB family protein
MPVKRIALSCAALALAVVAGLAAQDVRNDPGPLERRANPITPENPVPRRTFSIAPVYPAQASAMDATAILTFRVTLDETGRMAEIRQTSTPVVSVPSTTQRNPVALSAAADALTRSAISALQQWTYDSPAKGPITFTVSFSFRPGAEPLITQDNSYRPPPPPPPPGSVARNTAGVSTARADIGPQPVRVGGQIRQPTQLRRVNPVYPQDAQAARVQGVVILEVVIGVDGFVRDPRILRSIPLLDQAALDAVSQWQYSPTLLNNVPVPVIMTVTVQFTLAPPPPPPPPPQ